jgi:hypothetical protein
LQLPEVDYLSDIPRSKFSLGSNHSHGLLTNVPTFRPSKR